MSLGTTPSVEGAIERVNALTRSAYYTSGCLIGGIALGATLSTVGGIAPRGAWLGVAGLVAVAGLPLFRADQLYGRCWQVPKSWWRRFGDRAFVPAGATLTVGFFTPILFPTFWVMVALFLALPLGSAIAVGALYGGLRSVENWRRACGRPSLGLEDPDVFFGKRQRDAERLVSGALVGVIVAVLIAATTAGPVW